VSPGAAETASRASNLSAQHNHCLSHLYNLNISKIMNTMKLYIPTLSLVSALILSSCSKDEREDQAKKESPVTVTVTTAEKQSTNNVQGSGQITADETAMISTRIMGFITGINVKPGDKVQKGQLLVTISNGDVMAKRAQVRATVLEAEAALRDAQKDYDRYTELFKQQSASQKELENITLNYNTIKAKEEAALQMQNEADAMLAYTNLTAPFAGVVTQKNMDAGSMANPGIPILVIEQSGRFQVNTSVTEANIDKIKAGANAWITIESIGRAFAGKVSEVSPSSQMSGGQYHVKIRIPDSEKRGLHSGMYAKVSMEISESKNGNENVLVPVSAIVEKDQLSGLYTVSEHQTALLRWIKLGKKQGDLVEVLSGLTGDEKFILDAEGKLYNGVPVVIK
jgi:RND family efflux transporter MFP subunit